MTPPDPLIDVLSAESFAAEHLPGAINFCAYESTFVDQVQAAFPDPTTPLSLYGHSDATREAEIAVARLRSAGYKKISSLPGGLEGWKARGGDVERGPLPDLAANGRFPIDTEASFIQWTGRNLFNHHTGRLKIVQGHADAAEGQFAGAVISVDMNSLSCSDLTDSVLNAMLIAHLRSEDFFAVEKFPQATFVLSAARAIANATAGSPNYRIRGDLTLRGQVHEIEFAALIARQSPGVWVAQAWLEMDRTLWGAIYGSGKFFARLGQHVVNDLVQIQLKIVTTPPNP